MHEPEPNASSRNQRRIQNFLVAPLIQIKLGLYSILLAGLFSLVILAILYFSLADFSQIIFALTDSESEVRELFFDYMSTSQWWVGVMVLIYLVTNIIMSITYTHKLVGPSIAFLNHIRKIKEGDFSHRIHLRKGDAFEDIAQELNELTESLKQNNGQIIPAKSQDKQ